MGDNFSVDWIGNDVNFSDELSDVFDCRACEECSEDRINGIEVQGEWWGDYC